MSSEFSLFCISLFKNKFYFMKKLPHLLLCNIYGIMWYEKSGNSLNVIYGLDWEKRRRKLIRNKLKPHRRNFFIHFFLLISTRAHKAVILLWFGIYSRQSSAVLKAELIEVDFFSFSSLSPPLFYQFSSVKENFPSKLSSSQRLTCFLLSSFQYVLHFIS